MYQDGPFIYQDAKNKIRKKKMTNLPKWLKRPAPEKDAIKNMEHMLDRLGLATVCQSAHCPNIGECFNRGAATFMILGNLCTRNCRFCAVNHGIPETPDINEPENVAKAAYKLGLRHIVVTSVTRDDLNDGGADQFVKTIQAIRRLCPDSTIEILVPDFRGNMNSLKKVCEAKPDIFNHNIETVPGLYKSIRPKARYFRSIRIIEYAANMGMDVKSGLMLGLGETFTELKEVFKDLVFAGCRYLTLGQYLSPSEYHAPVVRYIEPHEFDQLAQNARLEGFKEVYSGPFVRSSYRADEFYNCKDTEKLKHLAMI